ncbi:phosphoribosylformylglycinamidine cyclo-ligase [Alkalicoccus urumqiensis]|uniref:Phosphoribosylformylglycinamidine cyclo-ligase n=1 Tax=Alkalicoccus urumqiensis TaxID=1548213 RepID=A0A2P6MIZ0_ALKUR|nr:phosphoribosylformylglycinamidine cyclo-ligase [Alkalicoccus urumqiensis]PRO66251.1 phosphoribosylformylglycinamidine cyclo-ligase [Alkalicoccus urumqiensis]
MSNAYKKAGVDVEAGYEGVRRIKKHVQKTMRPEVIGSLGGFGGMFDMSQLGLKEPVLISGTDGVGTKLMIAQSASVHDTIGIDAVAMCVNDIAAQGAEPLFFLDYLALGKNDPSVVESVVKGIADGCELAGCALVGGETAEMPGLYDADEYDVAGFAVGAAEKQAVWTKAEPGDVLIGLPSSGLHSNGFSLVRKIVEKAGLSWEDHAPFAENERLADALLTPTRIYVKELKALFGTTHVHGAAHITGGGLVENLPRMLPDGYGAEVDLDHAPSLPVFDWLEKEGGLTPDDMKETFNLGVGFVLAVPEASVQSVLDIVQAAGGRPFEFGRVTETEALVIHERGRFG